MAIKKINYHGTSKILLRLCEAVNSLIDSGGGGGSKHTIINKNGTAMSDRAGLQFTGGATVTDDSVNDKTVVQIPSEASDISFDDSQCRIISNSDDVQKAIKSADNSLYIYGDSISNLILALGDKASDPTTFTEASTRANIASGENFDVILGKIKKFFSDLKAVAFSGSADDVAYDANTTIKSAVDGKVSKSGDTMTGQLVVSNDTDIQIYANRPNSTTSSVRSAIRCGNGTADGTLGSTYGAIRLYGKGTNYTNLQATGSTSNRTIELPDKSGALALTSDISDLVEHNYTYTAGSTEYYVKVIKNNRFVEIVFFCDANIPNDTELCTLPENERPYPISSWITSFEIYLPTNTNYGLKINTSNGKVTFINNAGSGMWGTIKGTYISQ